MNYEATDVTGLETNFKEAVDDYLKLCQRHGKQPEKPFKGSFNVRIPSELHRTAAIYVEEHQKSRCHNAPAIRKLVGASYDFSLRFAEHYPEPGVA